MSEARERIAETEVRAVLQFVGEALFRAVRE